MKKVFYQNKIATRLWNNMCYPSHKQREDLKQKFEQITFFIKTFERPEALEDLLHSMKFHYGFLGKSVKIFIADDSKYPAKPKVETPFEISYFQLDFDMGLSYGRNYMLDRTETNFFVLLDDDFLFTRKTKIEFFFDTICNSEIDILSGEVYNRGKRKVKSSCCIDFVNGVLTKRKKPYKVQNKLNYYDFVVNFFIAKTEKIKEIRWDDELKIVEHTAFFLKAKNENFICAEIPSVKINHIRPKVEGYKKFRKDRINEFVTILYKKYGIKEVIEQ